MSFYVDYDIVNMILTIKIFEKDNVKYYKKIEFEQVFIDSFVDFKGEEEYTYKVYGYIPSKKTFYKQEMSNINEILDFDLKNILENVIFVENELEREIVKSVLPEHFCLILDDLNKELDESITIYKNI